MWSLLLIIGMGGHDHREILLDNLSIEACVTEVNNLKNTKSFGVPNPGMRLACEEKQNRTNYFLTNPKKDSGSTKPALSRPCASTTKGIECKIDPAKEWPISWAISPYNSPHTPMSSHHYPPPSTLCSSNEIELECRLDGYFQKYTDICMKAYCNADESGVVK